MVAATESRSSSCQRGPHAWPRLTDADTPARCGAAPCIRKPRRLPRLAGHVLELSWAGGRWCDSNACRSVGASRNVSGDEIEHRKIILLLTRSPGYSRPPCGLSRLIWPRQTLPSSGSPLPAAKVPTTPPANGRRRLSRVHQPEIANKSFNARGALESQFPVNSAAVHYARCGT